MQKGQQRRPFTYSCYCSETSIHGHCHLRKMALSVPKDFCALLLILKSAELPQNYLGLIRLGPLSLCF